MATIADILAGIDSLVTPAKRRLADMMRNPLRSAEQTVGLLGDQARTFDQDIGALADRNALRNAGSVMAGLPQYQQAEARTVDRMNSLLGSFAPVGMTVWHGSPHKFDRFDASKIGTGEGAQAYGYGLYVAESPDVAKNYAATIRRDGMGNVTWVDRKGGQVYKIDLPDDQIAKMLDWDKPLSQQPESVRKVISKFGLDKADERLHPSKWKVSFDDRLNGYAAESPIGGLIPLNTADKTIAMQKMQKIAADAYQNSGVNAIDQLSERLGGAKATAEALRQAGIPGIRYLDGGSRGAGSGTSNFVVFPGLENMLRILERNGEPVK